MLSSRRPASVPLVSKPREQLLLIASRKRRDIPDNQGAGFSSWKVKRAVSHMPQQRLANIQLQQMQHGVSRGCWTLQEHTVGVQTQAAARHWIRIAQSDAGSSRNS